MMKLTTIALAAAAVVSTAALAQTPAPKAPTTPAAPAASTPAPAVTMDAATEAKFKAADKDGNGMLNGAELSPFAPHMAKIDTNKDGVLSRDEFASAAKSGVIK